MVNRMAIGAATMALLFVGPAFAQSPQWAQPPQWGGVRTQANPYSSMPVYQAPPAPQTWTGTDLGAGISVWNGPNGRSMNCTRIGGSRNLQLNEAGMNAEPFPGLTLIVIIG
jgi:hypothetical protein